MQTPSRRPTFLAGAIAAALLAMTGIGASAQDDDPARLRVLHAASDAPTVDVYADGAQILAGIGFGTISDYLEVPAGKHGIRVFPADSDPDAGGAIIEATLDLEPGSATTLAATGSIASIEAQVIPDDPTPAKDVALLRLVHLAADVPPIDIAPDGGEEFVQGLAYPAATEYLPMPAGALDLEIRPAGAVDGWVVADPGSVFLSAGTASSQFVIGSLADDTFRLVTALDAVVTEPLPARVRLLHGSPDAPLVDVLIDGDPVLDDVAFGSISDYLELPAGDHRIQAYAADADPAEDAAILDATLPFAAGSRTTIAATGPLADLRTQVIADDPSPATDAAQLRVVHLAADAPALQVRLDGAKKPLIKTIAYPKASQEVSVKPGDVDLVLRQANDPTTIVLDLDPIAMDAGSSTSVFVLGGAEAGTLTIVTAVDATAR